LVTIFFLSPLLARLQNSEKQLLALSCLSAQNNSSSTGQIFVEFDT